jgi:ABC-type Fe3+-hydroxamate transport system substrate-binding protein
MRAPKRVVSLVPSDTYSVFAIGCAGALVGRTDYCVEPAEIASIPSVGGTKNPRVDDICDLAPDLVIANQEENTKSDLEQLRDRGIRIHMSFPKRVADGLAHLAKLARIFDVKPKALIEEGYHAVREAEHRKPHLRAFCPIWLDPLMTIHGETFISDMISLAGAENVFADRRRRYPLAADLGTAPALPPEKTEGRDDRYPRVDWHEIESRKPDLALLPDEPYAFGDEHVKLFAEHGIPSILVSGKDLCWYGAWSVKGLPRLRAQLQTRHPASTRPQ